MPSLHNPKREAGKQLWKPRGYCLGFTAETHQKAMRVVDVLRAFSELRSCIVSGDR